MSRGNKVGSLVVASLVIVASLAGCSPSGSDLPEADASDPKEAELLSSVDTMFGTVDVPKPEGDLRVLALGWSDAETALALGVVPIGVKDFGGFGEENKGVGPWATPLFGDVDPAVLPFTASQGLDYEQIQLLDPDVILYVNSGNDKDEYDKLSDIAPTIYGPEGTAPFATGWRVQTRVIAEALGLEEKGEELISDLEQQFADAAAQHPEFADLKAVVGLKYAEAYGANLPGDVRQDLLTDLGFQADPAVTGLNNAQGYVAQVPADQIEVLDSDVTVFFPIGYTVDDVRNDPLIQSLPVVKEDRALFLGEPGEVTQAFTAASVLSVPLLIEATVPLLAKAAAASNG